MKTWIFVYALLHESYNGYTHRDGEERVQVQASSEAVARRKAEQKMRKKYRNTRMEYRLQSAG